jgi:hypothetical protein
MFDRTRAYEFRSWFRSRYSMMIDSGNPEDIANAESCRLAAQAWEDIAQNCQVPGLEDEHGNPIEYDVEIVIQDIRNRWAEYCRTGVPQDEVKELVDEFQRKHQESYARRYERSNRGESDPQPDKGQKKVKVDPTSTVATIASKHHPIELKNEQNIKNVQENAIEIIINQIHEELGVARQESEVASGGTTWTPFES